MWREIFGDCEGAFDDCLRLDVGSSKAVPMVPKVLLLDAIDKRYHRLDLACLVFDSWFDFWIVPSHVWAVHANGAKHTVCKVYVNVENAFKIDLSRERGKSRVRVEHIMTVRL